MSLGSIAGGVDASARVWRWSAYGRIDYASAVLGAFTESGGDAVALAFGKRTVRSAVGVFGGRIERTDHLGPRQLRLGLRSEWRRERATGSAQLLDYADTPMPPAYSIGTTDWSRGVLLGGLTGEFELGSGWSASGDAGGQVSAGERLWSIAASASKRF